MPNGAYWSECEWKPPSEVVGDCALVPERVQGGSQRDIANPQERVQVALHFHDKSKTTHILQYVALELRCSCHWKTHQPEQRGEATKMEAGRRKKYVAALLPCGARY